MSDQEKHLATLLLLWSRSIEEHGLGYEEWLRKRQPRPAAAALSH